MNELPKSIDIKVYLKEYLGIENENDFAKIQFLNVEELPDQYKKQYEFLKDERLSSAVICVIPDDLWHKGSQPSESHAELSLILIKKSYFEGLDEIAWMTHEFAHLIAFSADPSHYEEHIRSSYPNNPVENFAFRRQFEYLLKCGIPREEIRRHLRQYYKDEEMPFFEQLL